jgi:hypothetical protein
VSTYAQERAARDRDRARKSRKYRFEPVPFDQFVSPRPFEAGRIVVKVQPYGCPRNGTMGMCYVGDAETGRFLGMVCKNSLVPA